MGERSRVRGGADGGLQPPWESKSVSCGSGWLEEDEDEEEEKNMQYVFFS